MTRKTFLVPLAGALLYGGSAAAQIGTTGQPHPTPSIDTLPAIAGHAWKASEQTCFYSGWARVRNSCSVTRKYLIAGWNAAPATTVITFSAAAESSSGGIPPQCRVVVNDAGSGLIAQTAANSIMPGPSTTTLGSASVSPDATFHFDCDITPDAQQGFGLAVVSWTPGDAADSGFIASPAMKGHAWLAAKQSCFTSAWARVWNNCTTTEKFLVPLGMDIPVADSQPFGGGWGFNFWAAGENDATHGVLPSCRVVMNDAANGLIGQTSAVVVQKGPFRTPLGFLATLGGRSVSAHVDCDIAPRSQGGLGLSTAAWGFAPTF